MTRFQLFVVAALSVVVIVIPQLGGSVINSLVSLGGGKFQFNPGSLFTLYGALLLILVFYLLYKLAISYRNSVGSARTQLGYVLTGFSFFALVSFAFGVILPLFNVRPVVAYDAQSALIWVALTAFAITKHGLFNVKVITTQVFVVLLLMLISSRVLSSSTTNDMLFELLVLALCSMFGYFLIGTVKNEVKRREEVEQLAKEKTATLKLLEQRNKNLATLQKISDIVLSEVDFRPTAQKLLDEIPNQIEECVGVYLSVVRQGKLTAYAFSSGESAKKIEGLMGKDLEQYSLPIDEKQNLLHKALVTNKVTDSHNLVDYFCPPMPKSTALTLQNLLRIKYVEAVPLYAHGEALGVMVFAYGEERHDIADKVFEVTNAVSSDMSLALQRAGALQKLKDANEYLSQLDKMKDEFISMASHELNTPLAAIEGYMSMILDEHMGKIDDKAKVYLERAFASSKRLADLILDLLNVSRIEQGRIKMKFNESDMVELAESVINELQVKSDAKKIYLKVEAGKGVPKSWLDPDRIREVLVNLSGNAIKFTEKGGITIKIEAADGGKAIRTAVVDTGRGIAKEDVPKLFQKFSQVHREIDEHQGTGLGLYISKNFVELHKGKIWMESEGIGKGTSFIFELPVMKDPPKAVDGAILEGPLAASTIVKDDGLAPQVVTDSINGRM